MDELFERIAMLEAALRYARERLRDAPGSEVEAFDIKQAIELADIALNEDTWNHPQQ